MVASKKFEKNPDADDAVVAMFSEEQAGRLTRLSQRRLRYWANTGFFTPSSHEGNANGAGPMKLYTFRDVVALRTLELLRVQNAVPLQHLRKVAERLSHLKQKLWTATTLYVVNRKVVFADPESGIPQEVLSGQYLLGLHLQEVMTATQDDFERMGKRSSATVGQITRNRSVMRNAWVVAGTRIPIDAIKRLHQDGYTVEQVLQEYPDLSLNDVRAALDRESDAA